MKNIHRFQDNWKIFKRVLKVVKTNNQANQMQKHYSTLMESDEMENIFEGCENTV